MRGFVALVRREARDLRGHFVAAAILGAAAPFVLHGWLLDGADAGHASTIGGRVIVPILFALFAMATASDLVAREVATHRIDALAVLPVPGSLVWRAKFTVLAVSSIAFLGWVIAADAAALATACPSGTAVRLPLQLVELIPSLLIGLVLGAASLFLSTLIERGMSAALGAIVLLVGIVVGVQVAELPAAPGAMTTFALYAVPAGLAAAFAFASRSSFVRGPIHGPSKFRISLAGFAAFFAITVPGGAAVAFGLTTSADLAPGQGDAAIRAAYLSPDQMWVAIEDGIAGGTSRTWLVGLDDATCRAVTPSHSWFVEGGAWTAGGMLRVRTSTFSLIVGPRSIHHMEIEPKALTVAEDQWLEPGTSMSPALTTLRGVPGPAIPRGSAALRDGRRVVFDGDVMLRAADGSLIRRLFPPQSAGEKGN